jgi:hypothetical protein
MVSERTPYVAQIGNILRQSVDDPLSGAGPVALSPANRNTGIVRPVHALGQRRVPSRTAISVSMPFFGGTAPAGGGDC